MNLKNPRSRPSFTEQQSFSDSVFWLVLNVPTPLQSLVASFLIVWTGTLVLQLSPFITVIRELYGWTGGEYTSMIIFTMLVYKVYAILVDGIKWFVYE